ncbi:MAG: hypothetical protein ACE5PV_22810 [Candidatus Poribacteria bacterium]
MEQQKEVAEIVEKILEEKLGDYFSRYLAGQEREYERIGVIERLIRLEEELKAQREVMVARFEAVDKRFESVNQHFEAMDKRFESVNQRFEAMDKRFEDLIHYTSQRFEDLIRYMDHRFEEVGRRFTLLTWLISSLFGALALLITVFKFVK